MKREQAEDFVQFKIPRRFVRDFEAAKRGNKARVRWVCETCQRAGKPLRETTYLKRNARLYTFLPRGGEHELYALRLALMRRRNAIEAVNSTLKRRGIGAKTFHKAAWVTEPVHMEWLINRPCSAWRCVAKSTRPTSTSSALTRRGRWA